MSFLDILQQAIQNTSTVDASKVEQAVRQAPKDAVGAGVADALRSEQTPPFASMISDLFDRASPEQRTAMLNAMVEKLGPGALAGVAGGALAGYEGDTTPAIALDRASQISAGQVRDVAAHAQQADPGIIDRMGRFYADHPDLVKTLGAGALMIALAKMKNSLKNG